MELLKEDKQILFNLINSKIVHYEGCLLSLKNKWKDNPENEKLKEFYNNKLIEITKVKKQIKRDVKKFLILTSSKIKKMEVLTNEKIQIKL